jgi:hypothetical protein
MMKKEKIDYFNKNNLVKMIYFQMNSQMKAMTQLKWRYSFLIHKIEN